MSKSPHPGYSALEQRLGYHFSDRALLSLALRHKSAGKPNNERLEFLGDAMLSAVVAEALFHQHDTAAEGELTTARARLVKGKTLASIGEALELETLLELGLGERKGTSRARQSILEDAVEAIIGAVYLDSDFANCTTLVKSLLAGRLDDSALLERGKDPKTQLQEYTQASKLGLPDYTVLNTEGPDHKLHFTIVCSVEGEQRTTSGAGSSRREAEQRAAREMLDLIAPHASQTS